MYKDIEGNLLGLATNGGNKSARDLFVSLLAGSAYKRQNKTRRARQSTPL